MRQLIFTRWSWLVMLLLVTGAAFGQESVKGRILDDETGEGLPGATIMIKGTGTGTLSDIDGNFTLEVSSLDAVLVVSYVGFSPKEIKINYRTELTISMEPDRAALDEVVVVGYGTVRKDDATGSVSVVKSDDFNRGVVNSPQELIQGKFAGVTVSTNSGAPGNSSTIRIRGASSIYASNDPLIVVDDVPLNNKGVGGAPNLLSTINPNDIETFTVLKDASATAIYGSRAAGGVIIITTKRGADRKLNLNYNLTTSLYTTPQKLDVYSADEFSDLITSQYASDHPARIYLGDSDTDWQDAIYKNAFGQDHNLSMSGSTDNLKYRVSLGYNNTDGVLKTYNFERTTLAAGIDPSFLNDKLKVQFNIKGMVNNNNFADQSAIANAVYYNPTLPIFNGNTRYYGYTTLVSDVEDVNNDVNNEPLVLAPANPVAQLALTDNTSRVTRAITNVKASYEVVPGLNATLNLGYDFTKSEGHNIVDDSTQWVYQPIQEDGRRTEYEGRRRNELLDFYINYKKELSQDHDVDGMLGYSWAHFYSFDYDSTWNLDKTRFHLGSPNPTEHYLISFFGRVNYSFLDKYLITFTLRNDRTSRFSPETRSGWFPSVALAWNVADESFLSSSEFISDLKLRLGYGVTGQQDVVNNDYPYIPTFTRSNNTAMYPFGPVPHFTLRPNAYDYFLTWETTTTYNIGLDFGFGQNRFRGSIDLYEKLTTDMINEVEVSAASNVESTIITNIGTMKNKGIELNLDWIAIDAEDWDWKLNANVFYNKNKVKKLNDGDDSDLLIPELNSGIGATTGSRAQFYKVGYPIRSFYVYEQVYGPNGAFIPNAFVDRNNDGVVNEDDRYFKNNPAPDITIGLNSWLTYKRFDLSVNARANINNYVFNRVAAGSNYYSLYNGMGYLQNMSTLADNTQITETSEFGVLSDHYVEDASFFKVDNINLAYNLPLMLNDRLQLQTSFGVQNALVLTKYKGLDPEVNGGMDNNFYPRSRIYMFGLKASF